MSNSFRQYFAQRVKYTFNHLHAVEIKADEPAIHDFRVEMKKMRAVIRFLREIYPDQKLKKAAERCKQIFREAGEIRELQLVNQWLTKHGILYILEQYFPEKKIADLVNEFCRKTTHARHSLKETMDDIEKTVQVTNQVLAEQYVLDLHARLKRMVLRQPGREEWHELRKLIKQWLYAANWIGSGEKTHSEADIAYYTKLQEAIGYWHDADMIREAIQHKKIYLSQSIEVQKDFAKANHKITQAIRYRERQVGEMLSRKETIVL
jgi:CHAD domain-containing protein